ncbi:hypothetical protein XSR1_60083 [Xenorhabdus szentirmaii DSM 16338]|uniref:Uncharacterized protein n=1 Tax=Xenorhabdus szentirmaii DSM 16338 TaxID=1427518 RepID=W1J4Q3_9GAMM|nr:hypothetical protein XSR1_60083 [Xenorhabdus szentirmaii DSM 16338]
MDDISHHKNRLYQISLKKAVPLVLSADNRKDLFLHIRG